MAGQQAARGSERWRWQKGNETVPLWLAGAPAQRLQVHADRDRAASRASERARIG